MERIKGKYDDLINKARPGSTWVSGFTTPGNNDDLRAIDADGALMHFEPVSRYYASCKIKRGQAVSIAQLSDLSEKQKKNKYAYVKITDPDLDETCLGIAMNYAEEGQIIHVQRSGRFNYHTTKSILNTPKRREREIFLNADGWNFDEVRGQRLFIKKLIKPENDFVTGHADSSSSVDSTDWFTYDLEQSIYNVKNTIQIGYLTDAPTVNTTPFLLKDGEFFDVNENKVNAVLIDLDADGETFIVVDVNGDPIVQNVEVIDTTTGQVKTDSEGNIITEIQRVPVPKANEAIWLIKKVTLNELDEVIDTQLIPVDDQIVTIELDVTGDTRGPVDNTQFVVTLGETIYFDISKKTVELSSPDFNQGIYDELKVLAIAEGKARGPTFKIFNKAETTSDVTTVDYGFIAIRKLDGDTYIIPVLNSFTDLDELEGSLIAAEDEGYIKLSKAFTTGTPRDYTTNAATITRSPKITIATDPILTLSRDSLKRSLSNALKQVFVNDETREVGCTPILTDLGLNGFVITTEEFGGSYDLYVSQNLLNLISITDVDHGQFAPAGTAILADIRDKNRLNIVGVVISNTENVLTKGSTVRVMKTGRIVTKGNVEPGKQYFLGLNGRITAKEQFWYDRDVPVGVAEASNYFIVDIPQFSLHSYSGNFPLGYMKPSVYGRAEKGFGVADGITLYSKAEYPEAYKALLNWFSEDELRPSNVSTEDFERYQKSTLYEILDEIFSEISQLEAEYQIIQDFDDIRSAWNLEISKIQDLVDEFKTNSANFKEIVSDYFEENWSKKLTRLQNRLDLFDSAIEKRVDNLYEKLGVTTDDSDILLSIRNSINTETENRVKDDNKLNAEIVEAKKRLNVLESTVGDGDEGLSTKLGQLKDSFETFQKSQVDDNGSQLQRIQVLENALSSEVDDNLLSKLNQKDSNLQSAIERLESRLTTGLSERVEVSNFEVYKIERQTTESRFSERITKLESFKSEVEDQDYPNFKTNTTSKLQNLDERLSKLEKLILVVVEQSVETNDDD